MIDYISKILYYWLILKRTAVHGTIIEVFTKLVTKLITVARQLPVFQLVVVCLVVCLVVVFSMLTLVVKNCNSKLNYVFILTRVNTITVIDTLSMAHIFNKYVATVMKKVKYIIQVN